MPFHGLVMPQAAENRNLNLNVQPKAKSESRRTLGRIRWGGVGRVWRGGAPKKTIAVSPRFFASTF